MTRTENPGERVRHMPDVVGGVLLAAFFGGAFYLSTSFDREDAVFPLGVSGLGFLLSATFALQAALLGSRTVAHAADSPLESEVDPSDDLDYVFATASRRQWLTTLGFFSAFFLSLFLLGVYATAIVFSVVYLRLQDGRSWKYSLLYAAVLAAVLHVVFVVALAQRLPSGALTGF